MQAIILAAGMGKRLKELTKNNTKCMVEINGVSLIERLLRQLEQLDLKRVVIVTGYQAEALREHIAGIDVSVPIEYVHNDIYDQTNNIYSLFLAKDQLREDDTLLFESDIICEDSAIRALLDDPRETLALVDKYESWMDGTCIKLSDDDAIEAFVPGSRFKFSEIGSYYKTVNIYKFSKHFSKTKYVPFLKAYSKALGNNEYYEQVLRVITMLDEPEIRAKRLTGQLWYEIDDVQDLDIATSMFTPDDDTRASLFMARYGGYWRYPKMLDFCYLVNPYYPPQQLVDELQANFEKLLRQYPSGMRVNAMLAAKMFGIHPEQIVVGNGAAELIKALLEGMTGKVGFTRPTFDEYPNRYAEENSVVFRPENADFAYTADDLMAFFADQPIEMLVAVNPDNPSGNYMPKADVLRLISWAKEKGIRLLVDESFVDFACEEDSTLLYADILDANPHLFVMKSISKCYGVPGLRLGVLASGDKDTIARLKKDVAIWNINSFAEFYLQIVEKYNKDYRLSLDQIRGERARFADALGRLPGVRVIPSQANYIMIEVEEKVSVKDLMKRLLSAHNILAKELVAKTGGNYMRIAVRDTDDNNAFLAAMEEELQKAGVK